MFTNVKTWTRSEGADPDGRLFQNAFKGNRMAFESLRQIHENQLKGFVIRHVGASNADDILQDIWLAAWQGLSQYEGRSRFKAWLYGIATHKCFDHIRKQARSPLSEDPATLDTVEYKDEYAQVERKQSVGEAMAKIPLSQREVLELYYFAELTLAEIANVLDRNLNTVKYQLYAAHGQMASLLKDEVLR